ncbi:cupin domain-containing protein [Arthrobacter sedimenti]|uniref:cupin domain-containing protein n=1 Tax=Arthrobacter sedimenti TaxID=2694931 RepID=UPI002D7EC10E|nr:cupin domain-containing protein [Arthrobacter sedimenti]
MAATELPNLVELWDWTLGPGDRHGSEAHSKGTKELLQVRQGSVTVEVGDESFVLEEGDAMSFPGDVAHAYANEGMEPARFSLAVFEPGAGSGHGAEVTGA